MTNLNERYIYAKEIYEKLGVNVDEAIEVARNTPISIHCWQGDNVKGFLSKKNLSGGIQVTGNYPFKARNGSELREDLLEAFKYIPGKKRVNLHAIYADNEATLKLEDIKPEHFDKWIKFAKENNLGLDFNPTLFSHPMADTGFTLSSNNEEVRRFWIKHCKNSRRIGEYIGKELNQKTVVNIWIPDGYKDYPIDRISPRKRLIESLDEIFSEALDQNYLMDSVESKLFGIGAEAYTTGSFEFYLGYAISRKKTLCIDTGHFHQTEEVDDKLSSVFLYIDNVLLHLSRPMYWDSDHVILYNDKIKKIFQALVRDDVLAKTSIALDFFDGSISPLYAWVIGTRNAEKALLQALLEPIQQLKEYENKGLYSKRLALQEEIKTLPFEDIFNYYCHLENVTNDTKWMSDIDEYEKEKSIERKI